MKQRQEFKVGDTVTFLSCGDSKRLPATVRRVTNGYRNDDDRTYYELSGNMVLSITTGKSILESEYCCDTATNYTGRQFRDVDGQMWTCLSDWAGNYKDYVHACKDGETVSTIEISEIFRFEQ